LRFLALESNGTSNSEEETTSELAVRGTSPDQGREEEPMKMKNSQSSTQLNTFKKVARITICSLALAVASTLGANAAILVVDCTFGPFFDIQTAVTAAAPGDSVVVHECAAPYNPFVVTGKDRVHVVAADLGAPSNMGAQRVGVATLPLSLFTPTVQVAGTAGFGSCIRIESSFSVSVKGFLVTGCFGAGVEIIDSEDTVVADHRIESVMGAGIFDIANRNTQITGNTVIFSLNEGIALEQPTSSLVTDNLVGANGDDGIFISGFDNHVVNNEVRLNAREGIRDCCGLGSRIERNDVLGNSGISNIYLDFGAVNADVIGNVTGGSLVDNGAGTDLADNS